MEMQTVRSVLKGPAGVRPEHRIPSEAGRGLKAGWFARIGNRQGRIPGSEASESESWDDQSSGRSAAGRETLASLVREGEKQSDRRNLG